MLFAPAAALLAPSSVARDATARATPALAGRRALLGGALAAVAAAPWAAHAEKVLTMDDDLSAPEPEPIEFGKPLSISVEDAGVKKKKIGPAERIKELEAKGGQRTDKEKKELRKLKQDEMCEMLGKGC